MQSAPGYTWSDENASKRRWGRVEAAPSGGIGLHQGLDADHVAKFLHGRGALFEGGIFFGGELDLDDLLDAAGAELARHADEHAVDPVLALEEGGAGQDLLLVLEDGLDHLRGGADGA
jgi:hypothetical protein